MDKSFNEVEELSRSTLDNRVQIEEEKGITLSQLFHMVLKHWVAIVILVLFGLSVGVIYGRVVKQPKYQAQTQLMVLAQDTTGTQSQKLELTDRLVRITYGYLTSTEVRQQTLDYLVENNPKFVNVKGQPRYDSVSIGSLYTPQLQYSTSNTPTPFIKVVATSSDKDMAIAVANAVVTITTDLCDNEGQLSNLLKNCLTPETTEIAKDSSMSNTIIALVGVLGGLVVGALYGVIRELLNTKVGSKNEIEQMTGYKVIGMIPMYSNVETSPEKQEEGEN